ncbi:MAG: acetyl-CoA decarbonylase/synthase complex subunit gamma [Nitrososphaerota archaeon]|jgi:acetyl-CoA decarbonylase/synthase complex subunit gamma|nr:acetyl-CoA decarbonylase/synthase complex subunit gamma [Nitrososphaerota archaeon]
MAEKKKAGLKELSPITIYKNLPKTNCKECNQDNCMAFATKIVNREIELDTCKPLLKSEYAKQYNTLKELLKPAVKEVTIGVGDKAKKIGGKLVMYRHEFTYKNPTAIAIDVTDEMPESEVISRVQKTENFSYEYIGNTLKLDLIAVRSTSDDADKFKMCVKKISEITQLPLVLVALNPAIAEAGLMAIPKSRPLIYAATTANWKEMAELAIMYDAPLVASAPNDLNALISLAKTLQAYGVKDVVLDPGTFANEGLADTLNNFTMLRRAATRGGEELAGLPLLGIPMVAWVNKGEMADDLVKWRESYIASMLITRFADALILHNNDGWSLLPTVVLRQNIYTDPRKPVAVAPGLKVFGTPDENSPVMFTSNFALTYYTVASDIESSKTNAYLIVVDAEGAAIDSGVAGRKLTAEKIADAIKSSGIESKVKHRKIISPGKASRISGEIEELSGWKVLVGPRDSSEIPKYIIDKWQP